jgi:cyclomaltodextrinase
MNYQFSKAAFRYFGNKKEKTKPSQFDKELARLRIRYPRAINYVLQNLYESHDTDRAVSRLMNPDLPYDGGNRIQDSGPTYIDTRPDEAAYRRLKLMTLFQATYVGAPMVWYGTEVGMFGADDPRCRMPMWWDDMMPYDSPDYVIDTKLRDYFSDALNMRADNEVLRTGDYLTAVADDEKDVFGFLRYAPDSKWVYLVVLNNSEVERSVTIPVPEASILPRGFRDTKKLFGEAKLAGGKKKPITITVPGISGTVVRFCK